MKWQQRTRMAKNQPAQQIKQPKPRNPHVAASRFRKAGSHGQGTGAARADAMRELRNQVKDLPSQGP